ncbi:MAG: 50S ribosomal protein L10 [Longimicrobiales bacterium]
MNLEQKQGVVAELTEKLRSANGVYLTDFQGLTVKRITDLRSRIRKEGAEYLVVKNTLAERALAELDLPAEIAEFFRGPTGLLITTKDPAGAAKIIADFAKENDDRPAFKAGIVDRRALTAQEVQRLATLPTREQLLAELAGTLQAPIAQLAFALQAKLVETAGLLEALKLARDGGEGEASPAAV